MLIKIYTKINTKKGSLNSFLSYTFKSLKLKSRVF